MVLQKPAIETKTISEVRGELDEVFSRVRHLEARVIVEEDGAPVAAIISTEDLDRLARLDREQQEAWDVLEAMREPFRGVPTDEIEREAERAFAAVRAENRRRREAARGR
ncbi:MAG: type II toxin-antitoxin system prevent-host-death family antitoxin [Thermomicrobiales bacterium]